jgi:hypothetical protein
MENTEISKQEKIDLFVKEYNEWLDKKPTNDELQFVHYSHLVVVQDIDDEGEISAINTTCSDVNGVNLASLLSIHEEMRERIEEKSKSYLFKKELSTK